jgi:hypothetical protein
LRGQTVIVSDHDDEVLSEAELGDAMALEEFSHPDPDDFGGAFDAEQTFDAHMPPVVGDLRAGETSRRLDRAGADARRRARGVLRPVDWLTRSENRAERDSADDAAAVAPARRCAPNERIR